MQAYAELLPSVVIKLNLLNDSNQWKQLRYISWINITRLEFKTDLQRALEWISAKIQQKQVWTGSCAQFRDRRPIWGQPDRPAFQRGETKYFRRSGWDQNGCSTSVLLSRVRLTCYRFDPHLLLQWFFTWPNWRLWVSKNSTIFSLVYPPLWNWIQGLDRFPFMFIDSGISKRGSAPGTEKHS